MPDDENAIDDTSVDDDHDETDDVTGYGLALNPGLAAKDPMDDWIKQSWASNYARKDGSLDADDYDPHHHKP